MSAGWLTREQLGAGGAVRPREARGLLLISPDAGTVVPLASRESREEALAIASQALAMAGIGGGDRVVVALSSDGELTGALLAEAAASLAEAAASAGPRGRLRLNAALAAAGATTLVITPTGAMDFLARLHLEFLLDPLDLELHRIVLTGEIASPGTAEHLAADFGAQVSELYADPVTGIPVAVSETGGAGSVITGGTGAGAATLRPVRDGLLALGALGKDEILTPPYPAGLAEIVLTPPWLPEGTVVRTGHVARLPGGSAGIPAPAHTVGEHVCVRGRWLPLDRLATALARIDGISGWELQIARAGTLDNATLNVTFARETLISNPMWKARIEQALVAITPVRVDVAIGEKASEETSPPAVTDLRGHHLGTDRARL